MLRAVFRRGQMKDSRRDIIILAATGIALIILIGVWGALNIQYAPVATLILYAGLIVVTMFYAYYSMDIARATRRQAEASMKMAKEMAIKRYSDSQPVLIPQVPTRLGQIPEEDVLYMTLASGLGGMEQQTPKGVTIRWRNAGKGVALNATFSLTGTPLESEPNKARLFIPTPNLRTALKVDEEKEVTFDLEWKAVNMSVGYSPRLEAEYQDIYERKLTTVQEFSFDKDKERAHLGELYFTVDGRRLGEEVTRHD
jgi:hypothetical protein